MYTIFYCFTTSFLGLIRDYSKHKHISPTKFARTPILCYMIHFLMKYLYGYKISIIYALLYERWFMFILKTAISIYNNDYVRKHEKYKEKYKDLYNKKMDEMIQLV
jgi:hypothetical protein